MKQLPEYAICFYAAFSGHDSFINERIGELYSQGIDRDFLIHCARALDVSGLLYNRILKADIDDAPLLKSLRSCFASDFAKTQVMLSLYDDLSALFRNERLDFMPLKGCDPRISLGPRSLLNPMEDIDILVRKSDSDTVATMLLANGYRFQGAFSDSHLTFYTDEESPRFVEIHHDVINRGNRLHSRLFRAPLENIWDRSTMSEDGTRLMSAEDLLSYSAAHALKEYFHKPKWIADCDWLLNDVSVTTLSGSFKKVVDEWGVGKIIGMIAASLDRCFPVTSYEHVFDSEFSRPGLLASYVGKHIFAYSHLKQLRPLIFIAAAEDSRSKLSLTGALLTRMLKGNSAP